MGGNITGLLVNTVDIDVVEVGLGVVGFSVL